MQFEYVDVTAAHPTRPALGSYVILDGQRHYVMDGAARLNALGLLKTPARTETLMYDNFPLSVIKIPKHGRRSSVNRHVQTARKNLSNFIPMPLTVDGSYTIIDGEIRLRAMRTMGMTHCPVIVMRTKIDSHTSQQPLPRRT